MLVLSRKPRQQIVIPSLGITLTVLRVGSGRVQIGIEAPREIQISRPDAIRRDDAEDDARQDGLPVAAEFCPAGA